MRQLLPTRFYPGKSRVGTALSTLEFVKAVDYIDGVDWYWGMGLLYAIQMLWKKRPDITIFQWWSGTVLHTYLLLAVLLRIRGAHIVIEFHEVLDTGEQNLPFVRAYVRILMPILVKLASGFVIHSEADRKPLQSQYKLGNRPIAVIPHGPYDHYQPTSKTVFRAAPAGTFNMLYFGVIRPFKGVEDLVTAFGEISPDEIDQYWLTIVGELWEGWSVPKDLIEKSRYRHRITLIDRYIPDSEVSSIFAGADAVVLPYHRSSASGPLEIAMSWGLPIITTQVGGLPEAVCGYEGVILVPPASPEKIREAIPGLMPLSKRRFVSPHTWEHTIACFMTLFADIRLGAKMPEAKHEKS